MQIPTITLVSLLSVIGAYFLLKILFSLLSKSKNNLHAVLLTSREELETIDLSLQSIKADRISTAPTAVLLKKTLFDSFSEAEQQKLQATAAECDANIYIYL